MPFKAKDPQCFAQIVVNDKIYHGGDLLRLEHPEIGAVHRADLRGGQRRDLVCGSCPQCRGS